MKEEEEARRPEHTPISGMMPVTVLPVCALQCLCLVQNQVLPLDTIEVLEVCNNQLVTCNHNVKTCFPCVQVLLVPKLTQDFAFLLVKRVPIRSVSQCKFHTSTSSGFKWPRNGSNIAPKMLVFISRTINVTTQMTSIWTVTTLRTWKFIQESCYPSHSTYTIHDTWQPKSYLRTSPVWNDLEVWDKAGHFLLPVVESGGRWDDQERAPSIYHNAQDFSIAVQIWIEKVHFQTHDITHRISQLCGTEML